MEGNPGWSPFSLGSWGKEEVGKDGRKADSKKGERRLVFPSLGPSLAAPHALLGRELAGALAARWFIPAPSLNSCLQLGRPNPQLSSELFFCLSLPPSFSALIQSVLPLFPLNLGSTFSVISLLPQCPPHTHNSLASSPSRRGLLESNCAWYGHLPCSPCSLPFPCSCPDSFSLPSSSQSLSSKPVLSLVL